MKKLFTALLILFSASVFGQAVSTMPTYNNVPNDSFYVPAVYYLNGVWYNRKIPAGAFSRAKLDSVKVIDSTVYTWSNGVQKNAGKISLDLSAYLKSSTASGLYATLSALAKKSDSTSYTAGQYVDSVFDWYGGVKVFRGVVGRVSKRISGGAVTPAGGVTYNVAPGVYMINNVPFSSGGGQVTLNSPDSTLPRIDYIVVNKSGGALQKITGTPASSPAEPYYDPATQFPVAFVNVKAAKTVSDTTATAVDLTNYYTKTESDNRYLQSFTEVDPTVDAMIKNIPVSADAATNKYLHWNGLGYDRKRIPYTDLDSVPDLSAYTPLDCDAIKGGVVVLRSGLTFDVSPSDYYHIACRQYSSTGGSITLDNADPTYRRWDKIVFDTLGQVQKITGIPSVSPAEPWADPTLYKELASVIVKAGVNEIENNNNDVAFDENNEWPHNTTGVNTIIDFSATAHAFSGAVSMGLTNIAFGGTVSFTAPAPIQVSDVTTVSFWLYLGSNMSSKQNILVQFFNGTSAVSSSATAPIVKTASGAWQLVSLNLSAFTFSGNTLNTLQLTFSGSMGGLYIDLIKLQSGVKQLSGDYLTRSKADSLYVSLSGAYSDPEWLTGLDWSKVLNKPTFFDGDYNSLTNKPTIPAAQVNADWNASSGVAQILNKPTLFNGQYASLSGIPSTFAPSAHTHAAADIVSGFLAAARIASGTATVGYVPTVQADGSLAYAAVAAGGSSLAIGSQVTGATAGSVFFAGTNGILRQDNANFFWDSTNKRLGIGTNAPSGVVTIKGISQSGNNTTFAVQNSTGTNNSLIVRDNGYSGFGTTPNVQVHSAGGLGTNWSTFIGWVNGGQGFRGGFYGQDGYIWVRDYGWGNNTGAQFKLNADKTVDFLVTTLSASTIKVTASTGSDGVLVSGEANAANLQPGFSLNLYAGRGSGYNRVKGYLSFYTPDAFDSSDVANFSTVQPYTEKVRITRKGSLVVGSAPAGADIIPALVPSRLTATVASAAALTITDEGILTYITTTNATFPTKGWYGWNGAAWEKLNN